jgi:hypothetical protein
MFCEKMIVLSDVSDIQQKSKIEDGEINSITLCAHYILHLAVNSEYPDRFDEQI